MVDAGRQWQPVFLICAGLLLLAALATALYLHVRDRRPRGFVEVPSRDLAGLDRCPALGAELSPVISEDGRRSVGERLPPISR